MATFVNGLVTEDLVPFDFSRKLTALQRSLYAYILTLLPNRTDAEDVLQETNLILCRKANEYDPEGHFQGWAFQIARYQVMAHITKSKRNRLQFSTDIIETLAAEQIDTKKLALSQKALQLCYDLLPEHMKQIARLRFREESHLKYIALKVGRPIGSVSATLHRIRINLTNCVRKKLPLVEAENDL